ncbi:MULTISPECIES: DUF3016 domain-containing protein [unclassified Massilia]|uniref:DUF3016 domain-containing protein n=1 Tax=unclassified Massilia TaxID=2609279 RepID=UPI0017837C01|nr:MULTISPECIES: DUF3016 domain-containing protein [unclassified Massilia]MBD8529639.1 DUF3016 domain-containing protein [Massilia sp. CFBP 13647]MBD8673274.1 DUF3016 domain-containing protein [Massilia sp. CFBP 13721]
MKNVIRTLAVSGLLALAAGSASADVTVNYIEQERFSDLPFTPWERESVLKELTGHFAKLGAKLPPGQNLRIDVRDVDLAGREYPGRGARDLRIVKNGAEWPRIDLRYTIESNGQVVRSGDAQLRDMSFMDRSNRSTGSDFLRFEKRMIDDWFYSEIMPRERAAQR